MASESNVGSEVGPLAASRAHAWLSKISAHLPGLHVQPEAFALYLAERGAVSEGEPPNLVDLAIACGCLEQAPAALAIFDEQILDVVREVVPRMRYHAVSVDELQQLLRVKLLCHDGDRPPKLAGYKGKGPLRGWVRVAAVRTLLNQKRSDKGQAAKAGELADLAQATAEPDPRTQLLLQQHRTAFRSAVGEALTTLTPMQQRLLRQHYLRGLTLPDLASIYQLHRVTVAKKIRAAREQVMAATRACLAKSFGLTDSDIDSLVHHLDAQNELAFEVSLASTVASVATPL